MWEKQRKTKKRNFLLALHLRQLVDRRGESKVFREELARVRIHQFVRLSDCDVRDTGDIADLLLRSLVF